MAGTGKYETYIFTFNWTKVELKQYSGRAAFSSLCAFNWTKVELKRGDSRAKRHFGGTFNWTKVELKLKNETIWEKNRKLLIELR